MTQGRMHCSINAVTRTEKKKRKQKKPQMERQICRGNKWTKSVQWPMTTDDGQRRLWLLSMFTRPWTQAAGCTPGRHCDGGGRKRLGASYEASSPLCQFLPWRTAGSNGKEMNGQVPDDYSTGSYISHGKAARRMRAALGDVVRQGGRGKRERHLAGLT